ncbi:uncharacterized protein swt1 isoform 2-T2 [Pholidichthys leucotaenia]
MNGWRSWTDFDRWTVETAFTSVFGWRYKWCVASTFTEKMAKHSKKRKRKRLSSSSSDEDVKVSKGKESTHRSNNAKRTKVLKSERSSAKKKEKPDCPTVEGYSRSSCRRKESVSRLAQTEATVQKCSDKEEQYRKTERAYVPFHREKCTIKSGVAIVKGKTDIQSKTVEDGPTRTSRHIQDEKSSKRSPSKSRKHAFSSSFCSSEKCEHRWSEQRSSKVKEPQIHRKTKEETSSRIKDFSFCSADQHEHRWGEQRSSKLKEPQIHRKTKEETSSHIKDISFCSPDQHEHRWGEQRSSKVKEPQIHRKTKEETSSHIKDFSFCSPDQHEHRWGEQRSSKVKEPQIHRKTKEETSSHIRDFSFCSQEEHEQRSSKDKEPSAHRKTREEISSHIKDFHHLERKQLHKNKCQMWQEKDSRVQGSLYTENSSTSCPQNSSTSVKITTPDSTLNMPVNITPVQQKTPHSVSALKAIFPFTPLISPSYKIPKKSREKTLDTIPINTNLKPGTKSPDSGVLTSESKEQMVQQAHSCLDATPKFSFGDEKTSLFDMHPDANEGNAEPGNDQVQIVEELHLARSEKRLEVNILESYGELTSMEIDPPEEESAGTHSRQLPEQDVILIVDTNILLSHLNYIREIRTFGLKALGFPVILIPWVVLQELDSLKKGRNLPYCSMAHLVIPAISYIYTSLKNKEPRLWGQSMQQATESSNDLSAENNDDRVLQCCLQYQRLYPKCPVILCTDDKNLCIKAILSGVKALAKKDLELEVTKHDLHVSQNLQAPLTSPQVLSPVPDMKQHSKADEMKIRDFNKCLSAFKDCLQEIIYLKPPWTLRDVLGCFKKHWIAVFGLLVPRRKLQNVSNLISFFNSDTTVDHTAALRAVQEARGLVKEFCKSSKQVPHAISVMDKIFHKLQPQQSFSVEKDPAACDVVMSDDDNDEEDKRPTSAQVSHQEVWAVFDSMWSNISQLSGEVFRAVGFDSNTMQCVRLEGGPPPPQDAVACLHKLSSMVSQLHQAFSSILSSAPGLEEVQVLLSILKSNKIVDESSLTAKDLLDCFSQPDYREKLEIGRKQLMWALETLNHCVQAVSQHITIPMQ